jgi:two-component system nitrogen regulation response regulator GlnG
MDQETDIFKQFSLKEMVEGKLRGVVHNAAAEKNGKGDLYRRVIKEVEESLIRLTLETVANKQTKAAEILGINRNTLRKKIEEFNL